MTTNSKQLNWNQRVALVRHNLHAASRSGNFHFFKTLQANSFTEGTNHVASLTEQLGDEADVVLASMDNLNAGLAYLHQDAFNIVYENLKNNKREEEDKEADKSKLYVDITMQKNMADGAIDKITTSALALIQQLPPQSQEAAAAVWITGVTIIANCMEVCLKELNEAEGKMNDFIRLEESWNVVKASVVSSVTAVKGVFRLMDPNITPTDQQQKHIRSASIASTGHSMLRRLSNAFAAGPATTSNSSRSSSVASTSALPNGTHARNSSVSSMGPVYRTPNYVRNSVSNGCPTSLPSGIEFEKHKLSLIPPTPCTPDDQRDPFDDTDAPPIPKIPDFPAMPALPMPTADLDQKRVSLAAF